VRGSWPIDPALGHSFANREGLMSIQTRRTFLGASALAVGTACLRSNRLLAAPLGLPIGLQLYSVRELLPKDFAGTLRQIGALGYREVEAAGFYGHTVAEVKEAMSAADLRCVSAHYSYRDLSRDFDKTLEFAHGLGLEYLICSFPGHKNPPKDSSAAGQREFTLEDWRWNADQFNQMGAKIKQAGMRMGYHNHTMEFAAQDGVVPFDELVRLTDPSLVTIEMDCGWLTVGGANPAEYLRRYPTRISMLHVKDFKKTDKPVTPTSPPPAAELGRGTADYHAVFAAASSANIKHYFVEQEEFDGPPMEALKIDADYMRDLNV
jgi:sugar phosphate isomerase/epimerase